MARILCYKRVAPLCGGFLGLAALLLSAGVAMTGDKAGASGARGNPLLGCWRAEDGTLVRFEAKRATVFDREKHLRFYLAEYTNDGKPSQAPIVKFRSPLNDEEAAFRPRIEGNVLTIGLAGILPTSQFRKLETVPPEIELKPMTLGEAKVLPREKVRAIQKELARRGKADQEVRHDAEKEPDNPAKREKAWQTDRDNVAYLISLLKEVGWIDAARFGATSSERAMRIAQHTGDLSLLAAVLPWIEKDIKANRLFTGQEFYPMMMYRFETLQAKEPALLVQTQKRSDATAPQPAKGLLGIGDAAPKLTVKEFVKGKAVTQFERGKIYVVELWATWCPPCRQTIPHLTKLQKKYQDIAIIGVSVSEDPANVKPFVEEMGEKMDYRVATDQEDAMAKNWLQAAGQNGIPAAFIVNGDGKIAWIGHPAAMDEPLEKIHAGKWDLKAAAAEFAEAGKKDKAPGRAAQMSEAERAAVRAVEALGGKVSQEGEGESTITVDLSGTRVTDAELKKLKELKGLQTLYLDGARVTDAGLKELKELKGLRKLDLSGTQVTDAGLRDFQELKELRHLDLRGTRVTDAGLKELKELKALRQLFLGGTKVTDEGVAEFKKVLPELTVER
jgi:thiol-disulfide isomerase/thioredoxin